MWEIINEIANINDDRNLDTPVLKFLLGSKGIKKIGKFLAELKTAIGKYKEEGNYEVAAALEEKASALIEHIRVIMDVERKAIDEYYKERMDKSCDDIKGIQASYAAEKAIREKLEDEQKAKLEIASIDILKKEIEKLKNQIALLNSIIASANEAINNATAIITKNNAQIAVSTQNILNNAPAIQNSIATQLIAICEKHNAHVSPEIIQAAVKEGHDKHIHLCVHDKKYRSCHKDVASYAAGATSSILDVLRQKADLTADQVVQIHPELGTGIAENHDVAVDVAKVETIDRSEASNEEQQGVIQEHKKAMAEAGKILVGIEKILLGAEKELVEKQAGLGMAQKKQEKREAYEELSSEAHEVRHSEKEGVSDDAEEEDMPMPK